MHHSWCHLENNKWRRSKEKTNIGKTKGQHNSQEVATCGFFVNPAFSEVGASPDGIVRCTCCGKGCIEMSSHTETTTSKRHVWLKTSALSLLMERYNWNKVTNITHKSKHKGFWQTVITVILWFGHSKTVLFCAYNLTLIFGGHAYRMFHDGVLPWAHCATLHSKSLPTISEQQNFASKRKIAKQCEEGQ